ncbi:LysR substrate binding domain protein [compost metagenome]
MPAPRPILSYKRTPVRDPLVLCGSQACEGLARQVERFLRQTGSEPLVEEQVASCDLMMALVAAGFALGLTGESNIPACRESGVVGRPLAGCSPELTTYLLRSTREPSATLARFIERAQAIESSEDA